MEKTEKKVGEIKKIFKDSPLEQLEELLKEYQMDERPGIKKICEQYLNKRNKYIGELLRLQKMKNYEQKYGDYTAICGIDEAGRGPLAGPVVAGAVILPKDCTILYLNDSKKLSEARREELYEEIKEKAVDWAVGVVSPQRIDEINILQATYEAMRIAVSNLKTPPDLLLNDAVTIPGIQIRQINIIKGDAKSISIAAGSIMAKVTRDRMMKEYDIMFPEYGFLNNKGYGSRFHMDALQEYGPSLIHRHSFIKNIIS